MHVPGSLPGDSDSVGFSGGASRMQSFKNAHPGASESL